MAVAAELETVHTNNEVDENKLDSAFAELTTSLLSHGVVSFTDREQSILSLHDQLAELRLESALLETQQRLAQGLNMASSS